MRKIDMTSEAVTNRLRRASDLRDLCIALRDAMESHKERLETDLNESLPTIQKPGPDTREAA